MPRATSEEAFEALIEDHLLEHGYLRRTAQDFDPQLALIPADLTGYVEETQPKTWGRLRGIHREQLEAKLVDTFDKEVRQRGLLSVLRRGFKMSGRTVRAVTFRPAHGLNPEVEADYRRNRVAVARQVHIDPKRPGQEADLVLFVNGIPVATAELKNALTGTSARNAREQYKTDRDPNAPIFRFQERALVHFAIGSNEVSMTTRLAGPDTYFLPFNRGDRGGAGNAPVEGKHATHYLWEETWQRDSLLDLLARFLFVETKESKGSPKGRAKTKSLRETMIFPRYHQLDVVRRLVDAARANGPGTNYLVQHSAGSGKSNSIAWLTHQLATLHDAHDRKIFDGVVVITDRQILDSQLQEVIWQIDHEPGVVRLITKGGSKSRQLADALEAGAKIIVCTIQSFGYLAEKLDELVDKSYAIVVDEAHSSQTGDTARDLKAILGASSVAERFAEEGDDVDLPEQAVLRAALARGPQRNLSYFAFTATPKGKTLEIFGHRGEDGEPDAFHHYTMRQAIEEGFILDVLAGYTTYERFYELVKAIEDDPKLDKEKASRALARFIDFHPENLQQKAQVIVEHFRTTVRHQLGGQAKAMVVTASRLHAVKMRLAIDRYLETRAIDDLGVLVAFSGSVADPDDPATQDRPYTEPEMNRDPRTGRTLPETRLREAFDTDRYQILIVAEKYQTGFDQPKLQAMYVDRRLANVQAVQTLSRLNRTMPGKGTPLVIDFVNQRDEILDSFQPYYEATTVAETVDPHRLYELRNEVLASRIVVDSEVGHFADLFFATAAPSGRAAGQLNERMSAAVRPTVDRFAALAAEEQSLFRNRLGAYVRLYGFLAQVVPFADVDLERLFVFGKTLLRMLPLDGEPAEDITLGEDVALKYYRLQKQTEGKIEMEAGRPGVVHSPTETGTSGGGPGETEIELSTLIQRFNERFGTDFDGVEDLVDAVRSELEDSTQIRNAAVANDRDNFHILSDEAFKTALVDRHDRHREFIEHLFAHREQFQWLQRHVGDRIYDSFAAEREQGR